MKFLCLFLWESTKLKCDAIVIIIGKQRINIAVMTPRNGYLCDMLCNTLNAMRCIAAVASAAAAAAARVCFHYYYYFSYLRLICRFSNRSSHFHQVEILQFKISLLLFCWFVFFYVSLFVQSSYFPWLNIAYVPLTNSQPTIWDFVFCSSLSQLQDS